jgi:XTP/dITP diphosphohydrolase
VLALARTGRTLATFEGVIEGRITEEPAGEGGFGYDPLFFHPPSGCTTAQLSTAEKQRVSHRGQAIAAFLEALHRSEFSTIL